MNTKINNKIKMLIVLIILISISFGVIFFSSHNSEKTIPKKAKFVNIKDYTIEGGDMYG